MNRYYQVSYQPFIQCFRLVPSSSLKEIFYKIWDGYKPDLIGHIQDEIQDPGK